MQNDLVVRASAGDHAAFSQLAAAAIGGLYRVAHLIRSTVPGSRPLTRAC